jgi:MinD superfamily P-loop ATPase
MAVDAFKDMGAGMGVIINKSLGSGEIDEFCEKEGIKILMHIPLDRKIAEGYSEGMTLVEQYEEKLKDLYRRISEADSRD